MKKQLYRKFKKTFSKHLINDVIDAVNAWIKQEIMSNRVIIINNFGRFNLIKLKCLRDGKIQSITRISFRPDPNLKKIPKLETKLRG